MALSPRFPISALEELVRQARILGVKDVKDIRRRIDDGIESFICRRVESVLRDILLELYGFDTQRLKIDISKQMMLKGTIQLTKQEKQHCLHFIWHYLSEYINDNKSFINSL